MLKISAKCIAFFIGLNLLSINSYASLNNKNQKPESILPDNINLFVEIKSDSFEHFAMLNNLEPNDADNNLEKKILENSYKNGIYFGVMLEENEPIFIGSTEMSNSAYNKAVNELQGDAKHTEIEVEKHSDLHNYICIKTAHYEESCYTHINSYVYFSNSLNFLKRISENAYLNNIKNLKNNTAYQKFKNKKNDNSSLSIYIDKIALSEIVSELGIIQNQEFYMYLPHLESLAIYTEFNKNLINFKISTIEYSDKIELDSLNTLSFKRELYKYSDHKQKIMQHEGANLALSSEIIAEKLNQYYYTFIHSEEYKAYNDIQLVPHIKELIELIEGKYLFSLGKNSNLELDIEFIGKIRNKNQEHARKIVEQIINSPSLKIFFDIKKVTNRESLYELNYFNRKKYYFGINENNMLVLSSRGNLEEETTSKKWPSIINRKKNIIHSTYINLTDSKSLPSPYNFNCTNYIKELCFIKSVEFETSKENDEMNFNINFELTRKIDDLIKINQLSKSSYKKANIKIFSSDDIPTPNELDLMSEEVLNIALHSIRIDNYDALSEVLDLEYDIQVISWEELNIVEENERLKYTPYKEVYISNDGDFLVQGYLSNKDYSKKYAIQFRYINNRWWVKSLYINE